LYFLSTPEAAAEVKVDDFSAELDLPIPGFNDVKPWMPKLNVGGDASGLTTALEAIIKKEKSTRRPGTQKSRSLSLMHPLDRRRLEASIPPTAHRGLRMLCASEVEKLHINCPVNITAGEFACVRISNIRLDITKIQALVEPILRKLVNPPADDAAFDEVAKPLLELDKGLPGISDLAGKKTTFLDIAEALVGPQSGAQTIRIVLAIWRGLRTLATLFASADADGILVADR
jgi:hypothetical protein